MPRTMADGSANTKRTVARQISIELQRMIVEGEIDPGQPLPSQREISERFGASRTSVREAISALEAAGLVHVEHGRGVFVRARNGHSSQDKPSSWSFDGRLALRDAYQIRALIEPFAVQVVTPSLSRESLAHLSRILENTQTFLEMGDYVALAKEDFAFHWTFAELSGNQLFCDILSRCVSLLPHTSEFGQTRIIEEHSAILEEVAMGRAESAAQLMYKHIVTAAQRAGVSLPDVGLQVAIAMAR